jgi:cytochrome P450
MMLLIGLATALLLGYFIYREFLHPAWISPLSKLPAAHPTSHFTAAWIWWRRRTGRESRSIFAAHQRCGSIVRLGPNEVSIASQEGLRKVYFGGFTRTEWVLTFRNYNGTPNLVTMLDSRKHATRRRMLSKLFSKSYLLSSADFGGLSLAIIFGRLLPIIDKAARAGSSVDVFEISCALAAEMMSAYQVGLESSLDFTSQGREAARKRHIENGKRKLRNLKGSRQASEELEDECFQMCLKADESLRLAGKKESIAGKPAEDSVQEGPRLPTTTRPVIFAQLSTSIPAKEGVNTRTETLRLVASELLDNIEAARVGVGITLTYAMYQLSRRPDLQSKLRDELMALPAPWRYPLHGLLSNSVLRQIDGIALLDAIIMETLRLNPSAPGPQYRAVPEAGVIVDGYFIPARVSISTSPYCLHRHAGAYPDADEWKPERWMTGRNAKAEQSVDSAPVEDGPRRWFWAFGRGGRMCIGSNFSLIGTYLAISNTGKIQGLLNCLLTKYLSSNENHPSLNLREFHKRDN